MTCQACTQAKADPKGSHAHMQAGCFQCQARAIAAVALHSESARTRRMTPEYRKVLQGLFGEKWEDGHEAVKGWGKLMKGAQ